MAAGLPYLEIKCPIPGTASLERCDWRGATCRHVCYKIFPSFKLLTSLFTLEVECLLTTVLN